LFAVAGAGLVRTEIRGSRFAEVALAAWFAGVHDDRVADRKAIDVLTER
jgi:hypothetical protein